MTAKPRLGLYGVPEPQLPPKPPSRWRIWWRILFGIILLVVISLAMLAHMGKATTRADVETYLGKSTGLHPVVDSLNAVTFYPVIGIDMDGVRLIDPGTRLIKFSAKHFNFSASFWPMAVGETALRSLDIRDAGTAAGYLTPLAAHVGHLWIDLARPDQPRLALEGSYGDAPVAATLDLAESVGLSGVPTFAIAGAPKFTASLGALKLDGASLPDGRGGKIVHIDHLSFGPASRTLTGTLAMNSPAEHEWDVKGTLTLGGSAIDLDIKIIRAGQGTTVKGGVKSSRLDLRDLTGPGGLIDDLHRIKAMLVKDGRFDMQGVTLDLTADIAALLRQGAPLGSAAGPLAKDGDIMKISPLKGNVASACVAIDINRAALADSSACHGAGGR